MEKTMKLSSETLNVLQNFAKLNSGIQFKAGNKIKTISTGKNVLAEATLKDSFPQDFCVYDLNQFLNIHSIGKDTDIEFDDINIIFKFGRNKTKYRKTEKESILIPPEKELTLPSVDITFTLSKDDFDSLMKVTNALQSPNIMVESEGDTINLTSFDVKDSSAHTNTIEVGEGNGQKYKMVFLTENLRMIAGAYEVQISSKGLSLFTNKTQDIKYFVATEAKYSKFGE
ncbi:DNA polymerase [bacterium]|nr:DNA polymerase [Candidatus Elulimicrobium humile]